ncbi:hypothetical protein D3C81_1970860 [compost metagenome]
MLNGRSVKPLTSDTGGTNGMVLARLFGGGPFAVSLGLPRMNKPRWLLALRQSIQDTVCSHPASEPSAISKNSSRLP